MKFLASRELGRLAKWLRILGFDAVYWKENSKGLIITALRDNRIVLTRNKILVRDKALKILCIKSEQLIEQLQQLKTELGLSFSTDMMFRRCTVCNTELQEVAKDEVASLVPAHVFETQKEFSRCGQCGRIYWHGTHWGNVQEVLEAII